MLLLLLSRFSRVQLCATHRRQPTRLPHPWDSPGKNTRVGYHILLQCMKVKSESEVAQSCPTLSDPMDCSLPGSSVHGIFQARVLEWVPSPSPQLLMRDGINISGGCLLPVPWRPYEYFVECVCSSVVQALWDWYLILGQFLFSKDLAVL